MTHQIHEFALAGAPRDVSRYNRLSKRRISATGSRHFFHDLFHLAIASLIAGLITMPGKARAEPTDLIRGEVVALAYDGPTATLFVATTDGIYRRDDGDRGWTALAPPPELPGGSIKTMAVSNQGNAIYIAAPGGMLRTRDGGESWTAAGDDELPDGNFVALAAHADQDDTVYVYVAERGIFRSEDGGSRWQLMDEGPQVRIAQLIHSIISVTKRIHRFSRVFEAVFE